MNNNLSADDERELERRRLVEEVTESIERTLKKRYTWLAIIMSFLIGGGVAIIVNGLTAAAREKLVKTQIFLEDIDELLKTGKNSIRNLQALSNTMDEEAAKIKKELESVNEARQSLRENLSASLTEISALEKRVDSLIKAVEEIRDKGEIQGIDLPVVSKASKVQKTIERTKLAEYTIFLHYSFSHRQDKPEIVKLAEFLKEKGYIVPGIEAVDGENRDIRYFKDEDLEGVENLKKTVEDYFEYRLNNKIKLDILNLKEKYPNIRKGTIELWLYL